MEELRKTILVNSWFINEYVSAAMWDLYSSRDHGIAIQTTYQRLKESLNNDQNIQFGVINYVDYDKEEIPPGLYSRFFIKRKSFQHENELRAAIFLPFTDVYRTGRTIHKKDYTTFNLNFIKKQAQGRYISVELDKLIEHIYISPLSKKWFTDTIISVARKYGIPDNLIKVSDLYTVK